MMPLSDLDSPIWIVASAAVVAAVSAVALCCNYNTWETPKDLLTISQVCAAYVVAAVAKRILRMRQRNKREKANVPS